MEEQLLLLTTLVDVAVQLDIVALIVRSLILVRWAGMESLARMEL